MSPVPELFLNGLIQGCLLGLVALGYSLAYGSARVLNFAHADAMLAGGGYLVLLWFTGAGRHPLAIFMMSALFGLAVAAAVELLLSGRVSRRPARFVIAVSAGLVIAGTTWFLKDRLSFVAAAVLAVPWTAALTTAVYRIAYLPLLRRQAPRTSVLLAALGMSIALQSWLLIAWGSQPTPFSPARLPKLLISRPLPPGVSVEQAIANYGSFALPGGLQLPVHDLIIIVVFGAVAGALWWFFSSTMIADAIVAAADSPLGARACGIPVHRVVGVAFFLGGGIASLGGSLYVLRMKSLEPHAGFSIGIIAFAACVLGGIGSLRGSVIGALLAGMVMSLAPAVPLGKWLREYLPSSWMPWLPSLNLADWSYGVVYCLMIVVILFRPRGLFAR